MNQNHFTLRFPLKTPEDAKALATLLPPLMSAFFEAEDKIGTIHYSRFTILSEKSLLFLGDFDGEFARLMSDLAKEAGEVFDRIYQHVRNPPATPVAAHVDAFIEWSAEHLLEAVNLYTAYPDVTAREIKALALNAGVDGAGELNPFLVILPTKSPIAFFETKLLLRARGHGITKDLDAVGTPHFAQFIPLEDNQIGFFTVYDGNFNKYIADSPKTSDRSLICCSSSPRVRRLRPVESTCKSSLTLLRARTVRRSASIRHIPGSRCKTSTRS
jgi:hypothetical protein